MRAWLLGRRGADARIRAGLQLRQGYKSRGYYQASSSKNQSLREVSPAVGAAIAGKIRPSFG